MNNSAILSHPRFCTGVLLASPEAIERVPEQSMADALNRHENGDYGLVTDQCVKCNELAVLNGFAVRSAYRSENRILFMVVTEADRQQTIIFMPHEWNRYVAVRSPGDPIAYVVPQVPLGQIRDTFQVSASISFEEIAEALQRHMHGDWGDVGPGTWKANDAALVEGERLLSSYRTDSGVNFWVMTEADRSSTTIFVPEEEY